MLVAILDKKKLRNFCYFEPFVWPNKKGVKLFVQLLLLARSEKREEKRVVCNLNIDEIS